MKTISCTVCSCCIVFLTMLVSAAKAVHGSEYTLPELVQHSDVICLGVTMHNTSQGRMAMDTGFTADGGKPYLQDAEAMVADFAVQEVFKGDLPANKDINILFAKNTPAQGANVVPFTELNAGERVLVFLKKGADDKAFILTTPINVRPAKVVVGTTAVPKNESIEPPLRKVLLFLVACLSSNDKALQLDCLTRIQSCGFLLNNSPEMFSGGTSDFERARQAMRGPDVPPLPPLEDFIRDRILPSVTKLLSSPNADTRASAIITAAKLQDVTVIPRLVSLIEAQPTGPYRDATAAMALGDYRVKEALKPLALLLNSSKDEAIKRSAAFVLREMGDPRALPFLLDHLDDPSADMKIIVVSGAFFLANEQPPAITHPSDQTSPANPTYVLFWKKWAREHQDKLKMLRAQFEAAP